MNDEQPPIDHSNAFRTRALLPTLIPLGILATVVGIIALIAWLLLFNTREGAAALGIVIAAGVLVGISLAASQDGMSRMKKIGAGVAVIGPVAIGAVIATGAFGLDEADLNVNAEPHAPSFLLGEVPADAPTLAAVDLTSFCLPSDGGGCEATDEWSVPSPEDASQFVYAFNNMDTAADHNLALYGLPGESEFGSAADNLGTPLLTPALPDPFVGEETRAYQFAWADGGGEDGEAPGQFYFVCTVHPSTMFGVGTIEG